MQADRVRINEQKVPLIASAACMYNLYLIDLGHQQPIAIVRSMYGGWYTRCYDK